MTMILIIFQKKIGGRGGGGGKCTILDPKMAHPHNAGSAVRIFLNLAQRKEPIGR